MPNLGWARHWVLRRLFGHEGEICNLCGRRYPTFTWWADSELWDRVVGDRYGLLCPRCFARLADEKGMWVCWTALPHDAWSDLVANDVKMAVAPCRVCGEESVVHYTRSFLATNVGDKYGLCEQHAPALRPEDYIACRGSRNGV